MHDGGERCEVSMEKTRPAIVKKIATKNEDSREGAMITRAWTDESLLPNMDIKKMTAHMVQNGKDRRRRHRKRGPPY